MRLCCRIQQTDSGLYCAVLYCVDIYGLLYHLLYFVHKIITVIFSFSTFTTWSNTWKNKDILFYGNMLFILKVMQIVINKVRTFGHEARARTENRCAIHESRGSLLQIFQPARSRVAQQFSGRIRALCPNVRTLVINKKYLTWCTSTIRTVVHLTCISIGRIILIDGDVRRRTEIARNIVY